jgi:hypothetical protein
VHMIAEATTLLIKARVRVSPDSFEHPDRVRLPRIFLAAAAAAAPVAAGNQLQTPPVSPIAGAAGSVRRRVSAAPVTPGMSPDDVLGLGTTLRRKRDNALPVGFELKLGQAAGHGHVHGHAHARGSDKKRARSKDAAAAPKEKGAKAPRRAKAQHTGKADNAPAADPTRTQPARGARARTADYADRDNSSLSGSDSE